MSGQDDKVGLRFVSHPREDAWEEYAFGRLPEEQVSRLEEHLLVCDSCQATLERVDTLIQSMRSAARSVEVPKSAPSSGVPTLKRWMPFPSRPVIAALSLGLLLALAGVGVFRSRRQQGNLPVAFVTLASFRGDATAVAPVGRPLTLEISRADIPPEAAYTLEVVTLSGSSEWKGVPEMSGAKLVGRLREGLGKGGYWVRLYGPHSELIREFGLRLE